MKCKKCKMDIPNGAKICPYCNSKQSMSVGGIIAAVILIVVGLSIVGNIGKGARQAQERASSSSQATMSRSEYISNCTEIAYEDLARNPDKYKGQAFVFTGKVIQVAEPTYGNTVSLRINVTKGEYSWSDTIFATVELSKSEDRILEDDILTIYGDCEGLYTYESIVGRQVSLPSIDIRYFSINKIDTAE